MSGENQLGRGSFTCTWPCAWVLALWDMGWRGLPAISLRVFKSFPSRMTLLVLEVQMKSFTLSMESAFSTNSGKTLFDSGQ